MPEHLRGFTIRHYINPLYLTFKYELFPRCAVSSVMIGVTLFSLVNLVGPNGLPATIPCQGVSSLVVISMMLQCWKLHLGRFYFLTAVHNHITPTTKRNCCDIDIYDSDGWLNSVTYSYSTHTYTLLKSRNKLFLNFFLYPVLVFKVLRLSLKPR